MVPKRYTTQMYLYFLPLPDTEATPGIGPLPMGSKTVIDTPTHDGGIEHTEARFLPAHEWIDKAQSGSIILFPPQFFLLSVVARFLLPTRQDAYSNIELMQQRRELQKFLALGDPSWSEVCISPVMAGAPTKDGRSILSLDHPGREVEKLGRKGLSDYVVVLGRGPGGSPKNVEVRLKEEIGELMDKSKM